ncbi:MAG: tripartite tricarboxylate transporter permease [Syntrophales bacterium]
MSLDLGGLIAGIAQALSFQGLIAVFVGVAWGILAGALPGITASVGMAIFLPFTWGLEAGIALMLLSGIYVGAEYGGSIPAILIRAPGEPSNVPATMDGFAMHMRGETGKALGYSLVPGTIASLFGAVGMVLLLVPLSYVSLLFGAPELLLLAILGLSAVVGLSKNNIWKGLASVLFGLLMATVGSDYVSGADRFTFNIPDLLDGIKTVPVVIGLLAMSEMLVEVLNIRAPAEEVKFSGKENFTLPTVKEYIRVLPATLLGSVIGLFVGVLPGAGATIASFISYNEMRRWSRDGDRFGQGVPDAIAAPEAANNAVVGGAVVPLLAFGIPSSASSAILMGGLILHGLRPGPMLATTRPDIIYSLFGGLLTASIAMYIMGRVFLKPWIHLVNVQKPHLVTCILALITVGTYGLQFGVFQVYVLLVMGIIGFFMTRHGFSTVATVLGLVLGSLIETSLRRSLVISDGSWTIFLTRPICLILLLLTCLSVVYPFIAKYLGSKKARP